MLATIEAKKEGFDEALMLDEQGNIAEGAGENLFIIKDKRIITVPLKGQILPGITRASVIELAKDLGYAIEERMISKEQLFGADEAFFTGTAAEIHPIAEVDGRKIGSGEFAITKELQEFFTKIVEGKIPKYEKWLAFVQ